MNTISGLEAQAEMSRLLDDLFGVYDEPSSEAGPDKAGEARSLVPDGDEGS